VDIDWQFELHCRSKQKVNRMMPTPLRIRKMTMPASPVRGSA